MFIAGYTCHMAIIVQTVFMVINDCSGYEVSVFFFRLELAQFPTLSLKSPLPMFIQEL